MKKSPLWFALAIGALFPLGAAAVLILVMPRLETLLVVAGLAAAAGALAAYVAHHSYRIAASAQHRIERGADTAAQRLTDAGRETVAAHRDADAALAARIERFLEEYVQRAKARDAQMLEGWHTMSSDAQRSSQEAFAAMREHFVNTVAAERDTLLRGAELRAKAVLDETRQALDGIERLSSAISFAVERHTAVVQSNEESLARFESQLEAIAARERELQEAAGRSRAQSLDAEVAKVRETFVHAAKRIEELIQERQGADQTHFQQMLEIQRKAHDEASERSGQLWTRLLDQLQQDGR